MQALAAADVGVVRCPGTPQYDVDSAATCASGHEMGDEVVTLSKKCVPGQLTGAAQVYEKRRKMPKVAQKSAKILTRILCLGG